MEIRSILVPTDFSASAEHALETAIGFAKAFGAKIEILHAYQLPVQLAVGEPIPLPQEFFDRLRDQAKQKLDEWIGRARAAGLEASGVLVQESPSHAIVDVAEESKSDLIVMGTRGLTGLKHVVLGSVAERTVRLAPCPVVTVRNVSEEHSQ